MTDDCRVHLVNPLPTALAHYAVAAENVLRAAGADVVTTPCPGVEVGGQGKAAKAAAALATFRSHGTLLREVPPADRVLVLWPAFGHLEARTWPAGAERPRVSVIVHDPTPLRRQHGLGRRAAALGARGAARIETISLSDTADAVLDELGWPTRTRLPHHISTPVKVPAVTRDTVSILGQFKPARDMEIVRRLGAGAASASHRYLIAGRGWPAVPGWEHDDRFVPEDELDGLFDRSAAVVVPYREFFQSGIAARALERLAPVVAPNHPMIVELLGKDWPGIAHGPYDWSSALDRALAVSAADMLAVRDRAWDRTVSAWSGWLHKPGR